MTTSGSLFGGFEVNIQALYDFDGSPREDGWFASPESPFACVIDGCSEPYSGKPFIYPEGFTGGQMVSRVVTQAFSMASANVLLDVVLSIVNEEVWKVQKIYRREAVLRNDTATLANASFSCLKFNEDGSFRCIWGADVFTIWQTKAGNVGIAGGNNREADLLREKTYADLVDAARGDSERVSQAKRHYWLTEFPRLKRLQDNVQYACLNGQPGIEKVWQDFSVREPVDRIVLLSDGAWIPIELWDKGLSYAHEFVGRLVQGNLQSAFNWVRHVQKQDQFKRVANPEATALVISFD
ncbi:MAG: hypothetical protein AAB877_00565 [Patescibacteria group bacterium]